MTPDNVKDDFAVYRDNGKLSDPIVAQLNDWIDMQIRRYGRGLCPDDASQSIWLHLLHATLPALRKMSQRKAKRWRSFVLVSIRNRIFTLQRVRIIGPKTVPFDEAIHGKET